MIVAGVPCTHFSLVNALRKGAADKSAWMAVEILRVLDDPDIDLDAIAIENVPAWAMDPEIPAACKAAAAKRGWFMQIIKILTTFHGAAYARRRIVIFFEPEGRTRDMGPIEDPEPTCEPVALSTILEPRDQIPAGLWAKGALVSYDGVQYSSDYVPRRVAYLEPEGGRKGSRSVVWSIYKPGWSTRTRESECFFLDDRGDEPARARRYTPQEELRLQLDREAATKLASEKTSKGMKMRVAGRAVCPELSKVFAKIIHDRRGQTHDLAKDKRIGKDSHAVRSAGITQVAETRERSDRTTTAPRRLNLTFGPYSAHPVEFDEEGAQIQDKSPRDGGDPGPQDTTGKSKSAPARAESTVDQGDALLRRLLLPLSSRAHQLEQRTRVTIDTCRPRRRAQGARRPRAARPPPGWGAMKSGTRR